MSLQDRLAAAIRCRGAELSYMNVYDYLYRGISTSEIHSTVAMDFHADFTDDDATFRVSPTEPFDVVVLTALTTRLASGAGIDVFEVLGVDPSVLKARTSALEELLGEAMVRLNDQLTANPAPEVRRALEELQRRADFASASLSEHHAAADDRV